MSKRIAVIVTLVCLLGVGCTFSRRTQLPRSASQQILATQAVIRALDQFEFPEVIKGKKVLVHVGAPGDAVDEEFLRTAVQIEVFEEDGRVVVAPEKADLVLAVLVGSMGLNIRGRFFGIEGTAGGGFIPFTIPELALYKRTRTSGFAQAEFALADLETGEIIERSDPVEGNTRGETTTVFMVFSWDDTDITSHHPPEGSEDLEPWRGDEASAGWAFSERCVALRWRWRGAPGSRERRAPKPETTAAPDADLAGFASFNVQAAGGSASEPAPPQALLDASVQNALRERLLLKG